MSITSEDNDGLFDLELVIVNPLCSNDTLPKISSKFELDPNGLLGSPPGKYKKQYSF